MLKERYILGIVAVIVVGIVVIEAKRTLKEMPVTDLNLVTEDRFAGVTSQGLLEKMKNGENFTLIDLRRPEEFKAGHIRGAINIPIGDIENQFTSISIDREIILYCTSGPWSRQGYKILKYKGFKNLKILINGIVGWKWEINGEVLASPQPER